MAVDLTLPLKAAIVDHLTADTAVTALVPASRIYGMSVPAKPKWPFIRYGAPITSGYEATCWDGSTTRVTLHAFAERTSTYSGEDRALQIAAEIVEAMATLAPEALGIIENEYLQTRCLMEDGEADRWHAIVEFNIAAVRR